MFFCFAKRACIEEGVYIVVFVSESSYIKVKGMFIVLFGKPCTAEGGSPNQPKTD